MYVVAGSWSAFFGGLSDNFDSAGLYAFKSKTNNVHVK